MSSLASLICAGVMVGAPMSAGGSDVLTVPYDPDHALRLRGRMNFQLTILFAADERIENVAIGDASSWQVAPNRRAGALFLKPLRPAGATNLTVLTSQRRYLFFLDAGPMETVGEAPYVVRFSYPTTPSEAPAPAAGVAERPYVVRGSAALRPDDLFVRDGKTFFRWPPGVAAPAIFARDAEGQERIVNYVVADGWVSVDQVAPSFVLRSGAETAIAERRDADRGAAHER